MLPQNYIKARSHFDLLSAPHLLAFSVLHYTECYKNISVRGRELQISLSDN